MAFCAVTDNNLKQIRTFIWAKITKNPEKLKDFKKFSQEVLNDFLGMKASMEKSISLLRHLPQIVSEYSAFREKRKLLKDNGVSLDKISDVEDMFETYESIIKFVGIKTEAQPVTLVTNKQAEVLKKIDDHIKSIEVTFEGNTRLINGTRYTTRVTSIAKAGYEDLTDENDKPEDSHALKHGNTVDAIAKLVFDDTNPNYEDFKDKIEKEAFDILIGKLAKEKKRYQDMGYLFRTGVTVFNKKLGISGEIDLLAISPEGELFIIDFKTSSYRLNETHLKNDTLTIKSDDVLYSFGVLSKWNQYGTQGYVYGLMLSENTGLPVQSGTGIIALSIQYDLDSPASESKILASPSLDFHVIPDVRKEYAGKNLPDLFNEFKNLENQSLTSTEEFKPTAEKPVRGRKPLSNPMDRQELDRVSAIDEIAATEKELQKEIDWFKTTLGKEVLLRLDNVVNNGLFGKWTTHGVTLYKNASVGTAYHEGWHAFSQLFLTKKQKDELYNSVKNDKISFKSRSGEKLNTSTASFLEIEEFLAEEFAKYALNPKEYKYPKDNSAPKNFFQRVWEFLKRYFGVNPRPIELFQKLYTGKINSYTPSINNAYWGKLNSAIVNSRGQEIISNERFPVYAQAIGYLIQKELENAKKSFTAFKQNKKLRITVLKNVFQVLEDRYISDTTLTSQQVEELYNISENKYDFAQAYMESSEFQTIKGVKIDEETFSISVDELNAMDSEDDVEESGDFDKDEASSSEMFTPDANEKSAMSLADDAIQDFFRTIEIIKGKNPDGTHIYELDEFGYPKRYTYHDIFYKVKKLLSGAFQLNDMIARIEDPVNLSVLPELEKISKTIRFFVNINSTEKNTYRRIQGVQFLQSFYKIMVMPEVDNMQLTINFKNIKKDRQGARKFISSFRKLSRNLSLKIMSIWDKNFKDTRGKEYYEFVDNPSIDVLDSMFYKTLGNKVLFNPFLNYDNLFPSSNVENVKKFFDAIGIILNPKAFTDAKTVVKLKEIKKKITTNINLYSRANYDEMAAEIASVAKSAGIEEQDIDKIFEKLPIDILDSIISKYYISSLQKEFGISRTYDILETKKGRDSFVKKQADNLFFAFEELAEIEEKFGERVSSGAFRVENKTKYPYYVPSQILITTELLNRINNTSDFNDNDNIYLNHINPITKKWMMRSVFYKALFDQNGNRKVDIDGNPVKIVTQDIASIKIIGTDGKVTERHPRSLTKSEKMFMDMITLFTSGSIEIPRAETSSTVFTIRLSDYGKGKALPISTAEASGTSIPESFHQIVKDYFAAEIEKRQWYMKNNPASPFAGKFNIFEGILSNEFKSKIVSMLDKNADDILDGDVLSEFRKEIEKYFRERVNEVLKFFEVGKEGLSPEQLEVLKDATGSLSFDPRGKLNSSKTIATSFILNHFVISQEFYNIFFGDLYHYKNPFKRGKFVTNTGTSYYIDAIRNRLLNSIQTSTLHSIYSGKETGNRDFTKLNTAVIEDVVMQSSYVNFDDPRQNIMLQDILAVRAMAGSLPKGTEEYTRFVQDTLKRLEKYKEINIADGQGIISLDFYRNFSIMTDIWSEEKEKEYERQKAIFRRKYNLYFTLDESGNKVKIEGEELEALRASDKELAESRPFAYFNPLKISYTGPAITDGPFTPVFDKFSVRPIIPEIAINTRDANLLLRMAEKDIDYVKFRSGSKVHQEGVFDWYKKNSDGTYNLDNINVEEITPTQLQSAYLKHQLDTDQFKKENILGSQFRKILFGIKYNPMVQRNPEVLKFFEKQEKEFFDSISELLKVEQADLFSLLGIEERGDDYYVSDMRRFLKMLVEESKKRGIPINNIEYLQYNELTKGSRFPIDYAFNRQQIQELLSGLIDDRLRRLQVNGSSLIQVSSAGFEKKFKKATKEDIKKYGTTGLHYYHIKYDPNGTPVETSTMGVKVSLSGDFKNLLNLPAPDFLGKEVKRVEFDEDGKRRKSRRSDTIGTLERLNLALQDEGWRNQHRDKLIMIGYRIPTQNNNFIDRMEIMEFLPESAGAIIIPPIELIVKSGSDFDIDKMSIIRPSIDREGKIISAPKESLEEISNEIKNLIYTEYDLRKQRKEVLDAEKSAYIEAAEIEEKLRKLTYTILNLYMEAGVDTSIVDTIIEELQSGKARGVSEVLEFRGKRIPKTDEEAFEDEDIAKTENDYEKLYDLISEYEKLEARMLAKLAIAEDKGKRKGHIERNDLEWFNKKKKYKNAQHNRMMSAISKTVAHPFYFESLITPSSTSTLDTLVNEFIASSENMTNEEYERALKETKEKLFDRTLTPEQYSRYTATIEAFDNLLSKRKDLGAYAIQRTFSDMFNFIKFSIAKTYTVTANGETKNKTLFTPLISLEDRGKVIQNGRILMHGDSVTGRPIKDMFDELISLTVDLANSPSYPKMNINNYNKRIVQYLLHQKVSPKSVLWFINQPILKELFELVETQKKKVNGYTLKHGIVELALRKKILANPKSSKGSPRYQLKETIKKEERDPVTGEVLKRTFETNEKQANPFLVRPYYDLHVQNLRENDFFSFEEMDGAIRSKDASSEMQGKVLAYFASIIEEADNVATLQFANNVDTTQYATITSIMRNMENRNKVYLSDLFDRKQLEKLEKESMIAPFDYTKKAYKLYKKLFPNLYSKNNLVIFSNLINEISGAKNIDLERISKIIENDYIEFIYKNYGTYEGVAIGERFLPLIYNTDNTSDHLFFTDRFDLIKAKYPELLDIPFVDNLYVDTYFPQDEIEKDSYLGMDNLEARNLWLQRNPDNPTAERNIFTDNWRNLINFNPESFGISRQYSEQEVAEISQFFHELIYLSLYQSGLTNTGNGFSDLIPYEHWAPFIEMAFQRYNEDIKQNPSIGEEMPKAFELRFKQMNPRINWSKKYFLTGEINEETGREDKEEIFFFKNYYRGKDYLVSEKDLNFVRNYLIGSAEEFEGEKYDRKKLDKKRDSNFSVGRYIEYNGKTYIIVKQGALKDSWMIHDPISSTTITVKENKVTALSSKGTVVEYGLKKYLVTVKNEIIDLDSQSRNPVIRRVTWASNNQARIDIIQLVNLQNTPNDKIEPGNEECKGD